MVVLMIVGLAQAHLLDQGARNDRRPGGRRLAGIFAAVTGCFWFISLIAAAIMY